MNMPRFFVSRNGHDPEPLDAPDIVAAKNKSALMAMMLGEPVEVFEVADATRAFETPQPRRVFTTAPVDGQNAVTKFDEAPKPDPTRVERQLDQITKLLRRD